MNLENQRLFLGSRDQIEDYLKEDDLQVISIDYIQCIIL